MTKTLNELSRIILQHTKRLYMTSSVINMYTYIYFTQMLNAQSFQLMSSEDIIQ